MIGVSDYSSPRLPEAMKTRYLDPALSASRVRWSLALLANVASHLLSNNRASIAILVHWVVRNDARILGEKSQKFGFAMIVLLAEQGLL